MLVMALVLVIAAAQLTPNAGPLPIPTRIAAERTLKGEANSSSLTEGMQHPLADDPAGQTGINRGPEPLPLREILSQQITV